MNNTSNIDIKIEKALTSLIDILETGYQILVEADFVGLMFHLLWNEEPFKNNIHLEGRILNAPNNKEKVDIIIGEIKKSDTSRPLIKPQLIIEAKALPFGFTNTQYKNRIRNIHKDINKISGYRLLVPRYIIIYDFSDHINTEQIKKLVQQRNKEDPELVIYIIKKHANNWKLTRK